MFPGDAIKISDASKQGDGLKATELQEKLSQAVIAISRHG